MSRHRYRVLLPAVLCCLIGFSGVAHAALIDPKIKSASPLPSGSAAAIATVINGLVPKLSDPDSNVVRISRQQLIEESDAPGVTAAYQTQYINSLVAALTPLMSQAPALQHNAAVVIGGVAAKAEKNDVADLFTPQVKSMVQSKDVHIAYWGVKTGKYALASTAAKTNKDGGLGKVIVDAVAKSKNAPVLIEEAYDALTFGASRNQATLAPIGIPFLLDLLEWRLSLYKGGTPPGDPTAESIATRILPVDPWWSTLAGNAQLQARALKDVGELGCFQMRGAGPLEGELQDAVKQTGDSIAAFGTQLKDPALKTAGEDLKKVTPNTDLETTCKKLAAALAAHNIQISMP